MSWKGMKVLVTGASGFIGRYLVDALVKEGAEVAALSTGNTNAANTDNVKQIKADITDPASIKGICRDIDVVYHLAAISNVVKAIQNPILTLNTNTFGTASLIEDSRVSGVKKFIYVSSAHVYGVPLYLPIDETHPVMPREPYAASKIASEKIVESYGNAYGMGYAIIRPFNIYGPGQDESFLIPGVVSQALKNKKIKVGNVEPTRDFLYVSDCIKGFLFIGKKGSGTINIGSGKETRISEVVESIRDIVDPSIPITSEIALKRTGNVEISRMCACNTRLKELGWEQEIELKEGLTMTVRDSQNTA